MREAGGNKPAGPGRGHIKAIIGVAAVAVLLLIGVGGYAVVQRTYTTVEKTAQQREAVKTEQERQAKAAAEAEAKRKAEQAEQQRLAAAKAEEEQAKAAAEAKTKRKNDEERQLQEVKREAIERLAAAKAWAEQAKRAAEAETKRKNDEEPQRAAQVEQERQAAVAEAEAKRKAAAAEAEQQRVPAAKAEQAKQQAAAAEAEQQRLAAAKAEEEQAKAAEAETKRRNDEERQRLAARRCFSFDGRHHREHPCVDNRRPARMGDRSGGGSAIPREQQQSRQFPWPPPAASAFYVLPDSWFAGLPTLGEVISAIVPALERNGYVERSFFGVEGNGVALVTRTRAH